MLLMMRFSHTNSMKCRKKLEAHLDSSWLGPALSPEPEGVMLSSELCQSSHSSDRGSSMGYASGGSSPEHAHEGQNPNYKEKPKE